MATASFSDFKNFLHQSRVFYYKNCQLFMALVDSEDGPDLEELNEIGEELEVFYKQSVQLEDLQLRQRILLLKESEMHFFNKKLVIKWSTFMWECSCQDQELEDYIQSLAFTGEERITPPFKNVAEAQAYLVRFHKDWHAYYYTALQKERMALN